MYGIFLKDRKAIQKMNENMKTPLLFTDIFLIEYKINKLYNIILSFKT